MRQQSSSNRQSLPFLCPEIVNVVVVSSLRPNLTAARHPCIMASCRCLSQAGVPIRPAFVAFLPQFFANKQTLIVCSLQLGSAHSLTFTAARSRLQFRIIPPTSDGCMHIDQRGISTTHAHVGVSLLTQTMGKQPTVLAETGILQEHSFRPWQQQRLTANNAGHKCGKNVLRE